MSSSQVSVIVGNIQLQCSDHPAEAQLINAMLAFKIMTPGSTPSVVRVAGGSSAQLFLCVCLCVCACACVLRVCAFTEASASVSEHRRPD